jgi:uncharacterized protein (TIGR02466 family)
LGNIHTLMPIPLYVSDIGSYDTSWLKDISYYRVTEDNGYISDDNYILENPKLSNLRDRIIKEIREFVVDRLGYTSDLEYDLTTSWVVKHSPKDWAQKHYHCNSMFSGVYYFDVPENSGDIIFWRDIKPMIKIPHIDGNEYTTNNTHLTPRDGVLIIFPSDLYHSIDTNDSNSERYCLAFNVFPRGLVGTENQPIDWLRT